MEIPREAKQSGQQALQEAGAEQHKYKCSASLGPKDRELLVLDAVPSADVPCADPQYKPLLHQGSIPPLLYASHKHEPPKSLFYVEINAVFPQTRSQALKQYFFGYPGRGDSTAPADAQNPAGSGNKPTFFVKSQTRLKTLAQIST